MINRKPDARPQLVLLNVSVLLQFVVSTPRRPTTAQPILAPCHSQDFSCFAGLRINCTHTHMLARTDCDIQHNVVTHNKIHLLVATKLPQINAHNLDSLEPILRI